MPIVRSVGKQFYNSMNKNNPDQNKFLISMIKNGFETARVDEFISARPDWGYLLERSATEGVFYPFYRNILALDGKLRLIPEEFRGKFQERYYFYLAKSADFSIEVERTLDYLDSLNIKMLLFKGPAIDAFIYDGYFRPRLDVDIVIKNEDIPVLKNALIPLHIHEHLINNTFLTMDGKLDMSMEKVAQESRLFKNYRNIYILNPELNILYLSEHALKHDFDQLIFLYEIERLINFYGNSFDWKKFILLAREFDMERIVYYGLYFVKELLSGDVPNEVINALRPKRTTLGEKIFIKETLRGKHKRYRSYLVYLAARKGLFKKTNFLFRTVFPKEHTVKSNLERFRRLVLR